MQWHYHVTWPHIANETDLGIEMKPLTRLAEAAEKVRLSQHILSCRMSTYTKASQYELDEFPAYIKRRSTFVARRFIDFRDVLAVLRTMFPDTGTSLGAEVKVYFLEILTERIEALVENVSSTM